jgi:hypothetical protein
MKYKRIIWWKKDNDDYEVELAKKICDDENLNLIIVDNFNDFANLIDPESFVVFFFYFSDTHLEDI